MSIRGMDLANWRNDAALPSFARGGVLLVCLAASGLVEGWDAAPPRPMPARRNS